MSTIGGGAGRLTPISLLIALLDKGMGFRPASLAWCLAMIIDSSKLSLRRAMKTLSAVLYAQSEQSDRGSAPLNWDSDS